MSINIWGGVIVTIGFLLFEGGRRRSKFWLYLLFEARARLLWGDKSHRFLQFSGVACTVAGTLIAMHVI